jgi:hypothetical protein
MMVEHDLAVAKREAVLKSAGYDGSARRSASASS